MRYEAWLPSSVGLDRRNFLKLSAAMAAFALIPRSEILDTRPQLGSHVLTFGFVPEELSEQQYLQPLTKYTAALEQRTLKGLLGGDLKPEAFAKALSWGSAFEHEDDHDSAALRTDSRPVLTKRLFDDGKEKTRRAVAKMSALWQSFHYRPPVVEMVAAQQLIGHISERYWDDRGFVTVYNQMQFEWIHDRILHSPYHEVTVFLSPVGIWRTGAWHNGSQDDPNHIIQFEGSYSEKNLHGKENIAGIKLVAGNYNHLLILAAGDDGGSVTAAVYELKDNHVLFVGSLDSARKLSVDGASLYVDLPSFGLTDADGSAGAAAIIGAVANLMIEKNVPYQQIGNKIKAASQRVGNRLVFDTAAMMRAVE